MILRPFKVLLILYLVTTSHSRRHRRPPPGCPSDPPQIPHGKVTTNGRHHGATATYTCDSNYKIGSGNRERKCNSGSWTAAQPTCILGCVHPGNPSNGDASISETSLLYKCNQGYRMVGSDRRNCVGTSWSGIAPQCEKLCQTTLSNPPHGIVTFDGNTATYTCVTNYRIEGEAVRLCRDGAWAGAPPRCILECGDLSNPANGRVTIVGTTAHYECDSGYRLKGNVIRTCQNQRWTASNPVCSKVCSTNLDSPDHGSVSVVEDTATYSCFTNYKIKGTMTRQCINGEWLGDRPTCVLVCSTLEDPDNGQVSISGNTAHYKCFPTYHIQEGNEVRTCQNNLWTGKAAVCTKRCEDLSPISNGHVSVDGQKASFSCYPLYQLIGNKDSFCINGQWSKSPPVCVLECGKPFPPRNGTVTVLGATAYFECSVGYTLVGDYVRNCDGVWSGTQPRCLKDSPNLNDPDNGLVTVFVHLILFTFVIAWLIIYVFSRRSFLIFL